MMVRFALGAAMFGLLVGAGRACPQAAQPVPAAEPQMLSPGAAYQGAMRPVEVTRRSIANWSEIEQAALAVAMKQGSAACAARKAEDYTGAALLDLSHLCALGQAWPAVVTTADRYLAEEAATKPLLADAYAAKIDAQLRMKDEGAALKTAEEMLGAVPYNAGVADATNEAMNFMELMYTSDAITLGLKRQGLVLELLRECKAETAATPGAAAGPRPAELYRQALTLAELQQLAGHPEAAEATFAELNLALPASVGGDDLIGIEGMRRRYARLGKPLENLAPIASLDVVARLPVLPAPRSITALLLFPDWCAQCIRLAQAMPESVFQVQGHQAYMFGLLVETMPAQKLAHPAGKSGAGQLESNFNPAYAAEYLKGTPTVTVGAAALEMFDATEVPLLIVVDSHGIVRLIDGVDDDALRPGGTVDVAIGLVGKQWPAAAKPMGRVVR